MPETPLWPLVEAWPCSPVPTVVVTTVDAVAEFESPSLTGLPFDANAGSDPTTTAVASPAAAPAAPNMIARRPNRGETLAATSTPSSADEPRPCDRSSLMPNPLRLIQ